MCHAPSVLKLDVRHAHVCGATSPQASCESVSQDSWGTSECLVRLLPTGDMSECRGLVGAFVYAQQANGESVFVLGDFVESKNLKHE